MPASTLSIAILAILVVASTVLAPMCGVAMIRESVNKGEENGGSSANTSIAAPRSALVSPQLVITPWARVEIVPGGDLSLGHPDSLFGAVTVQVRSCATW